MVMNSNPTFSIGDGKARTSFGTGAEYGRTVALNSNGSILAAGNVSGDLGLVRYLSDGTLDASFGTNGKVATNISGDDNVNGMQLQGDGKILVAGYSLVNSKWLFSCARYNADGSLDISFGNGGSITNNVGVTDSYSSTVVVLPDGRFLLGGNASQGNVPGYGNTTDFALVQYDINGVLDSSFGNGGVDWLTTPTSNENLVDLVLTAEGKIVAVGITDANGGNTDIAVARFNANGTLDTTFSGDGYLSLNIGSGNSNDHATDAAVYADGGILVAGHAWNGASDDFFVSRFNADGTVDSSFAAGTVFVDFGGGPDHAYALTIQDDGKILVAGQDKDANLAIARLNSNGTLDNTFDSDGKVVTVLGLGMASIEDIQVQLDGRIVVAGWTQYGGYASSDKDFVVVRYNRDGSLDQSFGATVTNTLGGTTAYLENGPAFVLDNAVQIYDPELAIAGSYNGASITLARHSGSTVNDVFSASGNLSFSGGAALVSGVSVGSVTNGAGTLAVTFNSNATQALVNEVLSSIAYSNSSDVPAASVQIDWTFNDGNTGAQGIGGTKTAAGSTTVSIIGVNDAPSGADKTITFNEDTTSLLSG